MFDLENIKKIAEQVVKECKTQKAIINALKQKDLPFTVNELGIHIAETKNGYVRIYKPYRSKTYAVQKWVTVPMKYSGIPTFNPSGLFDRLKG